MDITSLVRRPHTPETGSPVNIQFMGSQAAIKYGHSMAHFGMTKYTADVC